ncbi:unnamed protein product [Phyllotreta striolata]|uniref:Uncharacterized protein n=1 Tax=Phyllotreta striolata TaxID=444603 RepID=A0A9N9THC7_PHYSR|nr:unnamed protein product [Phyllotreta striolata]
MEKCGGKYGPCPGSATYRLDKLNCKLKCLKGNAAGTRCIVKKLRNVIKERNKERDHYHHHNKCSPLNCTLKRCPDPCGPHPCSVENTCPKYIEEVCSKYRTLWMHLCQTMTERSFLVWENDDLQQQIDRLTDQYITPHDDREICICCSNAKPGYIKCACCDCRDDEKDVCICNKSEESDDESEASKNYGIIDYCELLKLKSQTFPYK